MSFSNWLHRVAVRGCIALGFYLAVGFPVFAQTVGGDSANQPRAEKAQQQPKADNTPLTLEAIQHAIERLGTALEAQNDKDAAERKEKHEAQDLQAQWEQAKWAERMVYVGWAGVALTLFGLVMIYGTLKYTKEAAVAAKAMVIEGEKATAAAVLAAREAGRQVDLAEQGFLRLERPYLFVTGIERFANHYSGNAAWAGVGFSIGNHGKIPAIITDSKAAFGTDKDALIATDRFDELITKPIFSPDETRGRTEYAPERVKFGPHVDPDRPSSYLSHSAVPALTENERFFFRFVLRYRGPFSEGHETAVCYEYDRDSGRLVQWGGEEYNYSK